MNSSLILATQNPKDTHREKALSNKTPVLAKSMNMGIWVVGSYTQTKSSKKI